MLAFAANSLLCRAALHTAGLDPATFTVVRLVSGAVMLVLLVLVRGGGRGASDDTRSRKGASEDTRSPGSGAERAVVALREHLEQHWLSALAMLVYAAAFSYAYTLLTAATGALLLFGAVQVTMVGAALLRGERLSGWRVAGFGLATLGLVALLLPGLAAPPLLGALLMLSAGVAWGVYSLRGRGVADPTVATAGNFVGAAVMALSLLLYAPPVAHWPALGLAYAAISGALTSGLGYVVWYFALRSLRATEAAIVQLSVPVLAAAGGVLLLGEPLTLRLALCAVAILGGIALVVAKK